jgi:hypothetical protein
MIDVSRSAGAISDDWHGTCLVEVASRPSLVPAILLAVCVDPNPRSPRALAHRASSAVRWTLTALR